MRTLGRVTWHVRAAVCVLVLLLMLLMRLRRRTAGMILLLLRAAGTPVTKTNKQTKRVHQRVVVTLLDKVRASVDHISYYYAVVSLYK